MVLFSMGYHAVLLREEAYASSSVVGVVTDGSLSTQERRKFALNGTPVLDVDQWRAGNGRSDAGMFHVSRFRTWLREGLPRPPLDVAS